MTGGPRTKGEVVGILLTVVGFGLVTAIRADPEGAPARIWAITGAPAIAAVTAVIGSGAATFVGMGLAAIAFGLAFLAVGQEKDDPFEEAFRLWQKGEPVELSKWLRGADAEQAERVAALFDRKLKAPEAARLALLVNTCDHPPVRARLKALLKSPSREVRDAAFESLAQLPGEDIDMTLIELLVPESPDDLQILTLDTLRKRKVVACLPILAVRLEEGDPSRSLRDALEATRAELEALG